MSTLSIVAGCALACAAICAGARVSAHRSRRRHANHLGRHLSPARPAGGAWADGRLIPRLRRAAQPVARQSSREGDLDHLVFYLLQSTGFTSLPSIEPALSAKALVDGLTDQQREAFLRGGDAAVPRVCLTPSGRASSGSWSRSARPHGTRGSIYFRRAGEGHVRRQRGTRAGPRPRVPARDAVRLREGVRRPALASSRRRRRRPLPIARPQHRHGRRGGLRRVDLASAS